MKPEVLKSWSLEIDYSRAPCLGADQKARGLWERDWLDHWSVQPRSQGLSSLPPLVVSNDQVRQRRETLGTRLWSVALVRDVTSGFYANYHARGKMAEFVALQKIKPVSEDVFYVGMFWIVQEKA